MVIKMNHTYYKNNQKIVEPLPEGRLLKHGEMVQKGDLIINPFEKSMPVHSFLLDTPYKKIYGGPNFWRTND